MVDKLAVTGKGYKDAYADSKVTEADGTVSFTIPALKAGGTIILGVQEETIEPDKDIEANAITLNKTDLTLKRKSYTLKATVTPENSVDKTVTFKSSKSSVVKVDANGKVTAKKAGTATITATTKNGLKATCKITVTDPATKVYLTPAMSIKKEVP